MNPKAGDVIFCREDDDFYLVFIYQDTDAGVGLKVGELEESSIEDFKSFIQGKYNDDEAGPLEFTFSILQLNPKIIVTALIWLLLLLPFLFLVYFKFK